MKQNLSFQLCQSIRFNRPVRDHETEVNDDNEICVVQSHVVSPGGYILKAVDEQGHKRTFELDFTHSCYDTDENDPCLIHCVQYNPDYDYCEDLKDVTEYMLEHIIETIDWFIFAREPDSNEPLIPLEVLNPRFELESDENGNRCNKIFEITCPIKLSSNWH